MLCVNCSLNIPDDAVYCCYCGKLLPCGKLTPSKKGKSHRARATGSVYKRPDGKYQVTVTLGWYMQDGVKKRRTKSRTYVKKSDAINAAAGLKGERPSPRETVSELWEMYIQTKPYLALSDSQRDKLGYAYKRLEPVAFLPIAELTVDDLQRVVDGAVQTYYPARDMKVVLSHLYDLAIRREIVSANKSEYIDLPDAPRAKRETWTDADIDRMWADYASGQLFTGYVLIMCYCGLRYGELAKLELSDIDLDQRYMIGGIKTDAGTDRVIPISQRILPVVRFFYETRRRKLLEMGEDKFYDAYWTMIDRLQLRHLPPQTARHYYFSTLTAAGVQAGVITETGGHASYLTTIKNYVRIPLADKLAAVDLINPKKPDSSE